MLEISELFAKRRLVPAKLLAYGFAAYGADYVYHTALPESQLELTVTVDPEGNVSTRIIDTVFHEEYTLHNVQTASGGFVSAVRYAYETVILSIAEQCSDKDVFKSANARAVIEYIANTYGDEPEYLWAKFPDNAIFRIPQNQKWYAALLRVSGEKLGLPTDAMTDILDLKAAPEELAALLDSEGYLPGYHMNKKHWYTIPLEGSVPLSEICQRIDESYKLTHPMRI